MHLPVSSLPLSDNTITCHWNPKRTTHLAPLSLPALKKSKQRMDVSYACTCTVRLILVCIKWKLLTHDFFGRALISIFHTPGLDTQLQQDMATITEFIQPTGWGVKDVPRDSNSMFSAVVRQLSQADYDCTTEHSHYTAEPCDRQLWTTSLRTLMKMQTTNTTARESRRHSQPSLSYSQLRFIYSTQMAVVVP